MSRKVGSGEWGGFGGGTETIKKANQEIRLQMKMPSQMIFIANLGEQEQMCARVCVCVCARHCN